MTSFVVIEKATGKVVCESFDRDLSLRINLKKYDVVDIKKHLQSSEKGKNENHTQ